MLFKEIIGQETLKQKLVQTVNENRVSHAWYFFGPEGSGVLPLALSFARYILCTARSESDACGVCASCNKLNKYIHPDLHFSYPVNKTRLVDKDTVVSDDFITDWRIFLLQQPYAKLTQWYDFIDLENKQGTINTEESKRLAGKLNLKSFESEFKVAIIWQPEKMNDQAANKLLKLLEEPPPMTVFMLAGENPELMLSTIRSRCVQVKVPRITDAAIQHTLVDRYGVEPEKAMETARLASGNYIKAVELVTESDTGFHFTKFRELMRACFSKNIPELIRLSDELATLTREKQKAFLEFGLRTIRESMALHFNVPGIVYISEEEKSFIPNFSPFVTGRNVAAIAEELSKAIADIERNANGRMVFLDLSLSLASQIKRTS